LPRPQGCILRLRLVAGDAMRPGAKVRLR